MFIVFVHHICKPDMVDQAVARIDENGDRMMKIPGFIFRHRTENKENKYQISTVTGWADEAAYDAWIAVKGPADPGASPYEKVVNERHLVRSSHP
ncbi:MAG TPA: antibiotic biosynthesis monooxygenase [Alphaproteobacteria bacterium]|jgi:heme-degrading monooxygenase HmoA